MALYPCGCGLSLGCFVWCISLCLFLFQFPYEIATLSQRSLTPNFVFVIYSTVLASPTCSDVVIASAGAFERQGDSSAKFLSQRKRLDIALRLLFIETWWRILELRIVRSFCSIEKLTAFGYISCCADSRMYHVLLMGNVLYDAPVRC